MGDGSASRWPCTWSPSRTGWRTASSPPELNRITQGLASERRDWPWLEPPDPARYRMTVVDVLKATSGEEHVALVRNWAEAVWEAWAPHHDLVRGWAAEARRQRG